jgi:predicted ArsR family transcriptional regulator
VGAALLPDFFISGNHGVVMTKNERILKVLQSGNRFTVAQLAGLVDTTTHSVRARISELRRDGHAVYAKTRKGDNKTF